MEDGVEGNRRDDEWVKSKGCGTTCLEGTTVNFVLVFPGNCGTRHGQSIEGKGFK